MTSLVQGKPWQLGGRKGAVIHIVNRRKSKIELALRAGTGGLETVGTEILMPNGRWVKGPDLPYKMFSGCVVPLDDDQVSEKERIEFGTL